MALFDVPVRATREDDNKIAKKSKTQTKSTTPKSGGLLAKIESIRTMVEQSLGQHKDDYIILNEPESLHMYLDACVDNHYVAIDTETTGLNPLVDIIAGICIYTYGQKGAYVPINHVSYITGEKSAKQLDSDFIIREFNRLLDFKPDIDMFNSPFDIRVLRHFGLKRIYCTWDAQLAGRILNENEPKGQANLKALHNKYCLGGKGDAFRFDDLFKDIEFTKVPYNIGYLYAAHDPVITSELCDFQRKHLRADSDRSDIQAMYKVFKEIEMPLVKVVCDMEDVGVAFDFNKNKELKDKYHKLLDEREKKFQDAYLEFDSEIENYKNSNPDSGLDSPINIKSVKQLSILLYDIIGLQPPIDKKTKQPVRSTGEETLNALKNDSEVVQAILDYREFSTIVSTFIDKLPECVHTDGRIHCKFNQYGADTGRFSSQDPNLQNIPSHIKDIRHMFSATNDEIYVEEVNNSFTVDMWDNVKTINGWVCAKNIVVGDILVVTENGNVLNISVNKIVELVDKNQLVIYYE